MKKEHLVNLMWGRWKVMFGLFLIAGMIGVIVGLFMSIWSDFMFSFKIIATSLLTVIFTILIYGFINAIIKSCADDVIENEKKESPNQKLSKFQERLQEMAKKRGIGL